MAASRASSRALKHLAASSRQQTRSLSMTGPATFSSLLTSERPAVHLPRDIAGLQAECQKRNLPTTGSKAELTDRLTANDLTNVRTFSTAVQDSRRPIVETADAGSPVRHFNTSRALKAVNDSSTIDFAFFPDYDPDTKDAPIIRVPILPNVSTKSYAAEEVDEPVMLPTIHTVAADGTHIHAPAAMSEVSDNNSVDFQGMAAKVASKFGKPVEQQASMAKELWGGLMDDLLGPKGSKA
ncbi:uncharacterized protein BDR25DRAFT_305876 [Lindgomyces ingoldianus]|uniref:Uncharacterized protein n=1 Tax=Lindgomyces ingoldianus TaxID=673940 RepID=A0ACB6QJM7_9PLEO|nr:uncharacterized protein BDR25DRAFT_305876 [Lindgomyces ingoldianus]KAF2467096.1 hypothetical protein BDR25DRAFT_305876 [Lindgomyces ingoldianus]